MGQLVPDNVRRVCEVDKDASVAISVGHLSTIPESVVVVDAEMHRGSERLAGIINRVAPEKFHVEVSEGGGFDKSALDSRIDRRPDIVIPRADVRGYVII